MKNYDLPRTEIGPWRFGGFKASQCDGFILFNGVSYCIGTKKQEEKTRKTTTTFFQLPCLFYFRHLYTTPGNFKKNQSLDQINESFIWQTPRLPVPKRAERQRQVAPKNDAVIISTVASLMEDRHTGVCCSAVQVGCGWRMGSVNVDPGWFVDQVFFGSGGRGRCMTLETGRKSV